MMWTGDYESNKVLADALKERKNLRVSRRRCAWTRLHRNFKKNLDVPAELLFFLINVLLLSVPVVVVS